ncbi:protein THEM6-like isoform X2 [Eriocheir sinensis]|nr:protein THEM6-like isoform X1 [Eriocheir sinensis]XP_050685759.1 protein THEM6-like isoform X1 [Eriocheir sinensis]XP_050685761.1 protein THEM6-like isoform X1 [Eriocheir sinensis]XP_050691022.1 protein THEM6-like isoform X2 [Eriocheir sinensis]XP_050691023.1 protein THEM6-like isoform X2 [Eriocheir sinensis]XP_050691024.1 protein THEM6-like isoform X2 [Eriocheir sinensis]
MQIKTMVELTTVAIGILVSIEFGYFVKVIIHGISAKLFLSKVHPLKSSNIYGLCTTRDIDFMLNHINNGRYLRAMDFGRLDHCIRSGIFKTVYETKSKLLVAASTIRYRKPVYLFVPYRLQSQIVYWDEKNVYYRQDFVTLHDNFLRATAYVKLAVLGLQTEELFSLVTSESVTLPEAPNDLISWINYNKLNSESIKKDI